MGTTRFLSFDRCRNHAGSPEDSSENDGDDVLFPLTATNTRRALQLPTFTRSSADCARGHTGPISALGTNRQGMEQRRRCHDTQASVPSATRPRAQLAFKDSMLTRLELQFEFSSDMLHLNPNRTRVAQQPKAEFNLVKGLKVTSSDKVNSEERLRYKSAGGSKDCADDRKSLFLGVHHRERLPVSSSDVPLWLRRPGVKGNGLVRHGAHWLVGGACLHRVLPTADSSDDQQILEASGSISTDGAEGTLDSVAQSCHLRSYWVSLRLKRGVISESSACLYDCLVGLVPLCPRFCVLVMTVGVCVHQPSVAIPMPSLVRHGIIQRPYGFSFRSGIGPDMKDEDICAIGLSKVASMVGNPLYTDRVTKDKDRISFARVLVEVDVTKPLAKTIPATLPDDRELDLRISFEDALKLVAVIGTNRLDEVQERPLNEMHDTITSQMHEQQRRNDDGYEEGEFVVPKPALRTASQRISVPALEIGTPRHSNKKRVQGSAAHEPLHGLLSDPAQSISKSAQRNSEPAQRSGTLQKERDYQISKTMQQKPHMVYQTCKSDQQNPQTVTTGGKAAKGQDSIKDSNTNKRNQRSVAHCCVLGKDLLNKATKTTVGKDHTREKVSEMQGHSQQQSGTKINPTFTATGSRTPSAQRTAQGFSSLHKEHNQLAKNSMHTEGLNGAKEGQEVRSTGSKGENQITKEATNGVACIPMQRQFHSALQRKHLRVGFKVSRRGSKSVTEIVTVHQSRSKNQNEIVQGLLHPSARKPTTHQSSSKDQTNIQDDQIEASEIGNSLLNNAQLEGSEAGQCSQGAGKLPQNKSDGIRIHAEPQANCLAQQSHSQLILSHQLQTVYPSEPSDSRNCSSASTNSQQSDTGEDCSSPMQGFVGTSYVGSSSSDPDDGTTVEVNSQQQWKVKTRARSAKRQMLANHMHIRVMNEKEIDLVLALLATPFQQSQNAQKAVSGELNSAVKGKMSSVKKRDSKQSTYQQQPEHQFGTAGSGMAHQAKTQTGLRKNRFLPTKQNGTAERSTELLSETQASCDGYLGNKINRFGIAEIDGEKDTDIWRWRAKHTDSPLLKRLAEIRDQMVTSAGSIEAAQHLLHAAQLHNCKSVQLLCAAAQLRYVQLGRAVQLRFMQLHKTVAYPMIFIYGAVTFVESADGGSYYPWRPHGHLELVFESSEGSCSGGDCDIQDADTEAGIVDRQHFRQGLRIGADGTLETVHVTDIVEAGATRRQDLDMDFYSSHLLMMDAF
ncbi:hypothetical protein ZIOFF_042341 [Zingiber officinale]|uniref:Uncharacterized protein n=1 Tax=Zingiber officinale TaxID=94328 RepID=A0A8J5FVG9_ZINOF|nr:hypothetical protein ZIOFF_042341 [Zingiber officinale]